MIYEKKPKKTNKQKKQKAKGKIYKYNYSPAVL